MRFSATVLVSALLTLCAACGEPEPASLRFKTQPTMGYALERLSPVEVEILDEDGDVIEGSDALVEMTLDAKGYSATLTGGRGQNAKNGVARFDDLWVTKEGIDLQLVADLRMEGKAIPSARSASFSVAPVSDPPVGVAFRGALLDVEAGQTLPTFEVAIVTAAGVPYTRSDAQVSVLLAEGGLQGTQVVNAVRGVATFSDVRLSQPATGVVLIARVGDLPRGASQPFNVVPAGSPRLQFRVQPGFTRVNVPFSQAVEVAVVDASGNVLTGERRSVTVAFGKNLYNAQLTGTQTVETVNGVATFPGLAVDRSLIDATLIARSSGTVGAESTKFSVAP
jgi:hypothetical protein